MDLAQWSPAFIPAVPLLTFRDSWGVCKNRIRTEVGEDSFEAWFTSLRLVEIKGPVVRLSVISVFLKRRIIKCYSGALVSACKAEWPQIRRVELGVRSCVLQNLQTVPILRLPAPAVQPTPGLDARAVGAFRYRWWGPRELFPGHPDVVDGHQPPLNLKIEHIQRIVAERCGVSRADIIGPRRSADVVYPRQIAMYLSKVLTGRSLPEIGRRFGGRDHTTVLHAVNKIRWYVGDRKDCKIAHLINPESIPVDEELRVKIEECLRFLGSDYELPRSDMASSRVARREGLAVLTAA